MNCYKADLHIHTVLSPCGDLEMSPTNIVNKAKELGLDIIAIADHNCTLHSKLAETIAVKYGIMVIKGAEVTSKEEAHCLCFFESNDSLDAFQTWLDKKLPPIELDEEKFGYQLIVNEREEIVDTKPYLLTSAIDADIEEIYDKVHSLDGLFIPAHVNRMANSLTSQLGFVPPDLKADALEISKHVTKADFLRKNAYLKKYQFIQDSDAHYIHIIGEMYCKLLMKDKTFGEFRKAIHGIDGRKVENII